MSPETKKQIQLEIAHVLFVDIVGYSKLLIEEQRTLFEALNQIISSTEQFRTAETSGKLITIPTGDGMALVFQDRLDAPVECALEISRALKQHPELSLRMGIHSGPVSGVIDVSGRANVTGAGINVAQRVMDCGDAGHILLSKHVAEDLEQYARWKSQLHDIGPCEVKHGARINVVNLYTQDIGNPELPSKLKPPNRKIIAPVAKLVTALRDLYASLATPSTFRQRVHRWATVVMLAGILIAIVFLVVLFEPARNVPPSKKERPLNLTALAQKARRAVVLIIGYDAAGKPRTGSGFFISDDGRVVTNWHVVDGVTNAQAKEENGASHNIEGVVASSAALDLAILKANARGVEVLSVDDAAPPEPGTRVAVIGSPLAWQGSLSEGIVSAIRPVENGTLLQITAPISPGSSGSPVLERHGRVVGVATLFAKEGQNLNFARSSRDLLNLVRSIDDNSKPRRLQELWLLKKDQILDDPGFIAAVEANKLGDGAKALKLLNTLAERYPSDSRLLFQLACAYETLGLHDEAYQNYRSYIAINPTDAAGWHNFAVVAANLQKLSEAINACTQTLKIKPDASTWRMLGDLYGKQGERASSAHAYDEAKKLESRPTYTVVAPESKGLNIRADHSAKAAIVATLKQGDPVFLEDGQFRNNDPPYPITWQRVTSMNGDIGWFDLEYLAPSGEAINSSPTQSPTSSPATSVAVQNNSPDNRAVYVVVAPSTKQLNIRADHDAKSAIVAVLNDGDRVFLEKDHFLNTDPPHPTTWQKVTTVNGLTGWCDFDYLAPFGEASNSPRARAQRVRELFKDWLRISNAGDTVREASLYSDPVDYLDFGTISRQQLVQNLQQDLQRWPKQFNTTSKDPAIEELTDSEWRVTFEISFDARDPSKGKRVTGTANLTWTVRKRDSGEIEITSSKEQVTSRKWHDIKRTGKPDLPERTSH